MPANRSAFPGEGRFRHYRANLQAARCGDLPAAHLLLEEICTRKEPVCGDGMDELKLYHEERLTALGIMAAGIAHELNQPLNTIRVVTDGFLFGRTEGWPLDQEELLEGLEMISRQVIRMDKVIRNVRNFARDERGNRRKTSVSTRPSRTSFP